MIYKCKNCSFITHRGPEAVNHLRSNNFKHGIIFLRYKTSIECWNSTNCVLCGNYCRKIGTNNKITFVKSYCCKCYEKQDYNYNNTLHCPACYYTENNILYLVRSHNFREGKKTHSFDVVNRIYHTSKYPSKWFVGLDLAKKLKEPKLIKAATNIAFLLGNFNYFHTDRWIKTYRKINYLNDPLDKLQVFYNNDHGDTCTTCMLFRPKGLNVSSCHECPLKDPLSKLDCCNWWYNYNSVLSRILKDMGRI